MSRRPRLVALDLDETLLDENSQLTPVNRAALERAAALGIQIVVATGRAYDTIPAEVLGLPMVRYAITGNGAAIYDLETGTAIRRQVLPEAAAGQVLAIADGFDAQYEVFVEGAAYAQADYLQNLDQYLMDDHRQAYVRATWRPVPDVRTFIRDHAGELDSLAVIPRSLDSRARLLELLPALPSVYVTTSHIRLIEINHRDCTKAAGLQFLAEQLGVAQADTAAFGNGDNDAGMLAWAGCGISVAEGSEQCRAAADYVAGSYRDSGVGKAFWEVWEI